jgi:UDP-N-acetylmuramate--alanine ligase
MEGESRGAALAAGLGAARRIHLVGIAGSGLSGLARLLASRGFQVSGSEQAESATLEKLRGEGIRSWVGQGQETIPPADLMVISAAVGEDNPELAGARRRGIPVLKYSQCLGRLMAERTGIAVAGTHGKTTTTAMVAWVLRAAGRDPGFLIGGEYPGLGGSSNWGSGPFFVAEACEFDRSFLNLHPTQAIVTNVEEDHLDYFQSIEEIREAFGSFVGSLPPHGLLIANADDPHSRHLPQASPAPSAWFSLRPGAGDVWAEEIEPAGGGIRFLARSLAGERTRMCLRIPGVHNVKNALAATLLLRRLSLPLEEIGGALEDFGGVRRRFEILLREPVVVIDDYAHHPTEIDAVLRAARETFPGLRIRLIFQPHQHSRTRRFLSQFARVLAQADEAVVAEVFRARDSAEDARSVSGSILADEVGRLGGRAVSAPTFGEILEHLQATVREGEVLICLGAGDITLLARRIAEHFASPALKGGLRECLA